MRAELNTIYLDKVETVKADDYIAEVNLPNITKEEIVRLLNTYGVIKKSHFELLSGLHSTSFIQFNLLAELSLLRDLLATSFINDGINLVITPDTSGVRLASGVADVLDVDVLILPIGQDSYPVDTGAQIEYAEMKDRKALIVSDIITSGKSILNIINMVKKYEGYVAGVAAFINRGYKSLGQIKADSGIDKIVTVCTGKFDHFASKTECLQCRQGDRAILLSKELNFGISSSHLADLIKSQAA